MSHPLDGARLKVVRAQEHLDSLKSEILRYLDTDSYVVTVKKNPDNTYGGSADITHQPDPRLGAIIGDCLHNLSCALDYTMWEIADTFAGRMLIPPPNGDDRPYFPIWTNPTSFKNYVSRLNDPKAWNYQIPDPVIAEFEAVQPDRTGYEKLAIFRDLVNADKHRLPLVAVGDIYQFMINVSGVQPSSEFPPHLSGDPAYYEPKVQTQATVYVTWQDPSMPWEPVERTLEDFIKLVANIIPRFDSFCDWR
jgi:hypothetical protein